MTSRNKRLGTGLENRVVERAREAGLEATKQPLSGVLKDFPHDAVVENTLVECKVRTAKEDAKGRRIFPLDFAWLHKVRAAAAEHGFKSAVLIFNVTGGREPYAVITLSDYIALLKKVKEGGE